MIYTLCDKIYIYIHLVLQAIDVVNHQQLLEFKDLFITLSFFESIAILFRPSQCLYVSPPLEL
jgi:hypothetical protein